MENALQQKWNSIAAFGVSTIVRLWPEETKDWARAFAAELPEIEGFSESVRWLLGGVMLLTRERFRHFLKSLGRPAGLGATDPLGAVIKSSRRVPRTPRVVTAMLLGASLAILLHPEVRTSVRAVAVRESWNPEAWSTFHDLQRKAAETGDARLLALLSLLNHNNSDRARLGSEAIAKDPSFIWLAYRYFYPADSPDERTQLHQAASERNKSLQEWDPDNAVPRLFAAELLFEDIVAASPKVSSFHFLHPHELNALEKTAAANSEWLATMDGAFRAPQYDTYASRRLELVRNIASQYHINDPDVTGYVVAGGPLPQFSNVLTYAHILLYRNSPAGNGASDASAAADAWKVLHFAQRMQLRGRTRIEDIIAIEIAQQACERLQPLLEKTGQRDQAALINLELERSNVALERIKSRNQSWSFSPTNGNLAWTGLTIHIAAYAALASLAASLAALALFARTARSTNKYRGFFPVLCSLVVDIAPPLLLLTCVVLFVAYHPYARTYQSYFQAQDPSLTTESMEELAAAAVAPYMFPQILALQPVDFAYLGWLSLTVALSMLAVFLMYRMWWPRRTM
ncbi:MAG TPA: hypothetical protein VN780_06350 [Candidatus Eisenbacteria bacterium]|jgi:hypothetical protein|nr:hypothetical protein [Candidatus Eisenbacteria bacterium]